MHQGQLAYLNHRINFWEVGNHEDMLLLIHGFGFSSRVFHSILPALANRYHCIAIDLPFHGETQWKAETYSKEDIIAIINAFFEKYQKGKVYLLGYSLGARLILSCLEKLAPQVEQLFLLAPDGFRTKGVDSVFYVPVWTKPGVRFAFDNYKALLSICKGMYRMGLLDAVGFRFMLRNLSKPFLREQLFYTWLSIHQYKVDKKELTQVVDKNQLSVKVILGKHDIVIDAKTVKNWALTSPMVKVEEIEAGHILVNQKLIPLLCN